MIHERPEIFNSRVFQLRQRQETGLCCGQMNSESFNGTKRVPGGELLQIVGLKNCYHRTGSFTFILPRDNKQLAVAKKIMTVKRNLLK